MSCLLEMTCIAIILFMLCFIQSSTKAQKANEKIVGGETVSISEYPYQISIEYRREHLCGASIVSKINGLTAAHCIKNLGDLKGYAIRAGSSIIENGGMTIPIRRVAIHPNYNNITKDYDIAIIEFTQPLQYDDNIQPIKLAKKLPPVSTKGTTTGWGALSETGAISYRLQAVSLPILSDNLCKVKYPKQYTSRMFCAGYFREGGQDSCQGDSGGPMAYKNELIGVVSWGVGCARRLNPGVYSSIPYFQSFLKQYIKFDN